MKEDPRLPPDQPLRGKTFSLQQGATNSDGYYEAIAATADYCLDLFPDAPSLLELVQSLSRSQRNLRRLRRAPASASADAALVHTLHERLSVYTPDVGEHLKRLSLIQRFEKTLTTTEEQYHLYMLEIELANRINGAAFRAAGQKVAFLPHCLRDQTARCRAAQKGLDLTCKGCSQVCGVNAVSRLLRDAGVEPYIWMEADLPGFFKEQRSTGQSTGVLGIACIPELVEGMRLCQKFNLPVVGIPLDANRCVRWFGEFRWNTTNLDALDKLVNG
jgi:hypothetical protein